MLLLFQRFPIPYSEKKQKKTEVKNDFTPEKWWALQDDRIPFWDPKAR